MTLRHELSVAFVQEFVVVAFVIVALVYAHINCLLPCPSFRLLSIFPMHPVISQSPIIPGTCNHTVWCMACVIVTLAWCMACVIVTLACPM